MRAASITGLRGTYQQHACFKTIWKKAVRACELQRDECCAKPGMSGLNCCSIWMAHMTTWSGCSIVGVTFCWQENSLRHSMSTMTSKLSPLKGAPNSLWLQLLKSKRLFLRVQALSWVFYTMQRRRAHWRRSFKWSASQFWHSLYWLRITICSMRGPDGERALVAPSCIL